MTDLRNEEHHWGIGEVLKLSWPASLSMLNVTVMRFVDGVMVSRLGPGPFSAQFVGGMSAFVPESFALGMLTVVNTFVSQNLGAGRRRRCGQYAWAGMMLAIFFALLVAPLALFSRPLFGLFGHAEVQLESMYFRYMILSMLLTTPIRVLEAFFYGIHRPGAVMKASLIAAVCNVVGNYVLIFGKLGLPAMGLEGAAIATIGSWGLQFVILLAIFLSPSMHRRYGTHFAVVRGRQCRDILRVGSPAGVQFVNNILPWTVFMMALVGKFGMAHRAAGTAVMRYVSLSFMPAVGIGIATTALVGQYIGAGRRDLARHRAHAALVTAMVYMGLCGLGFWLFRYPLVSLFVKVPASVDISPAEARAMAGEMLRIGGSVMLLAAVFQLFDAISIVYSGALRGAGDTFWPMVITATFSWTIIIGGGYLMTELLPQLTSIGPWIAASSYVIALGIVLAWRFESGVWRKIDLLGRRPKAGVAAQPGS
ncbi:MAG: MATE family efflux transporter [Phycisphaerae bacterium]|nr:MATE family efflux transporter [Phycisphaerae bacterium]